MQLKEIGENLTEYESIYGYTMNTTENRFKLFEYPEFQFEVTDKITNFADRSV